MSSEKQPTTAPQPNPAKTITTPNLPTKSTRDGGGQQSHNR